MPLFLRKWLSLIVCGALFWVTLVLGLEAMFGFMAWVSFSGPYSHSRQRLRQGSRKAK